MTWMTLTNLVNVLIGLWKVVAPFVLRFSNRPGATWTSIIIGLIQAILHAWAMRTRDMSLQRRINGFNALIGVLWVIHPIVFGLTGVPIAFTAYVVAGVITIALSYYAYSMRGPGPIVGA